MEYTIKVSETARKDLLEITVYLRDNFGMSKATEYMDGLKTIFALLQKSPQLGKIYKPTIRRLVFKKKTVLFFTPQKRTVYIIRVFDARKDWLSLI